MFGWCSKRLKEIGIRMWCVKMPTPRVVSKRNDYVMPRRQPRLLHDGRRHWRQALTSRPDVTTGNTDVTPTASPLTSRGNRRTTHLPESSRDSADSHSRLARTVGTTCRGKPFPVDAASHSRSAGADRALPPIYKPPVRTSLTLSLLYPLWTDASNTVSYRFNSLCLFPVKLGFTIGERAFSAPGISTR